MTCIAFMNMGNALIFAGDGVAGEPVSGDVVANNQSKIIMLPELQAVASYSGMGYLGIHYKWVIQDRGYQEFDALAANIDEDFGIAYRHTLASSPDHGPFAKSNLIVGGFSREAGAFRVIRVTSYGKESVNSDTGETTTLEPFKSEWLDHFFWASTMPTIDLMEEFSLGGVHAENVAENDVNYAIRYVCRYICASRQSSGYDEQAGYHLFVGGMVQICVLDTASVLSWIPFRWPEDELGKPIDTSKGERLPDIFKVDYEPTT